jgi:hypothetical protein
MQFVWMAMSIEEFIRNTTRRGCGALPARAYTANESARPKSEKARIAPGLFADSSVGAPSSTCPHPRLPRSSCSLYSPCSSRLDFLLAFQEGSLRTMPHPTYGFGPWCKLNPAAIRNSAVGQFSVIDRVRIATGSLPRSSKNEGSVTFSRLGAPRRPERPEASRWGDHCSASKIPSPDGVILHP